MSPNLKMRSSQNTHPFKVEVTDWTHLQYYRPICSFLKIKFYELTCIRKIYRYSMRRFVCQSLEKILQEHFYVHAIEDEAMKGLGIPILSRKEATNGQRSEISDGFFLVAHRELGERFVIHLHTLDLIIDQKKIDIYTSSERIREAELIFDLVEQAQKSIRHIAMTGSGGILALTEKVEWDEIILPQETKQLIYSNTIGFLERKDQFKKVGLPAKRGIFLIGAPGNGKTLVGKWLATHADANFIWVTPKDLQQGREAESLAAIFSHARDFSPVIVLFDDVDLTGVLNRHDPATRKPMLCGLLCEMDGIESDNDGIVTIATTNLSSKITTDQAFRPGRFDCKILIDLPRFPERVELLKLFTRKVSLSQDVNIERVAVQLEGFSCASIREVIQRCAIETLETEKVSDDDIPILAQEQLIKIIESMKERKKGIGFESEDQKQAKISFTHR